MRSSGAGGHAPHERLAREIAGARTVEDSVRTLVAFVGETLSSEHVSLSRTERSRVVPVATTSATVRRAEELQVETREGPCADDGAGALASVSSDLARDARWPVWGPKVAELGFTSAVWTPLLAGGRRLGTMTVYAEAPEVLGAAEREVVQALSHQASTTLRVAREIEGLTLALDSRTVVGQAQGILMERFGLDDGRAFAFLRRYSQDHNVKLTEVARGIVDASVLPDGRHIAGRLDERFGEDPGR